MIDKVAYPMPDAPNIDSNHSIISQNVVDSLLERKIKIAIFPRMAILNSIPEMGELHKEYYSIPSFGHIVRYFLKKNYCLSELISLIWFAGMVS